MNERFKDCLPHLEIYLKIALAVGMLWLASESVTLDQSGKCDPRTVGAVQASNGQTLECHLDGWWPVESTFQTNKYNPALGGTIISELPPSDYPDTLDFDHWAGPEKWNSELGAETRVACFTAVDGMACDIEVRLDQP